MPVAHRVGQAVAAVGLLAIVGCSPGHVDVEPKPDPGPGPTSAYTSYVAMGDSYVAGPGILPVDATSGACERSLGNWPRLLAKKLQVKSFHDASCSGATSGDIVTARPAAGQDDAQIDAVGPDTDLVTLGIGGNDENLFGKMLFSCAGGTAHNPPPSCPPFADGELGEILGRTASRVTKALEDIRAKAPQARIILVGYLRLLPEPGGCEVPGLAADRTGAAPAGQNALEAALSEAAERAEVEYVSMSKLSVGHESCRGKNAWVNGFQPDPGDGAFIHPNAAGMQSVATAVAATIERTGRPSAAASADRQ